MTLSHQTKLKAYQSFFQDHATTRKKKATHTYFVTATLMREVVGAPFLEVVEKKKCNEENHKYLI